MVIIDRFSLSLLMALAGTELIRTAADNLDAATRWWYWIVPALSGLGLWGGAVFHVFGLARAFVADLRDRRRWS